MEPPKEFKTLLKDSDIRLMKYDPEKIVDIFSDGLVVAYCKLANKDLEDFKKQYPNDRERKKRAVNSGLNELWKIASSLNSDYYTFEEQLYKHEKFESFNEQLNTNLRKASKNMFILKGKAGIGKTAFLTKDNGFKAHIDKLVNGENVWKKIVNYYNFGPEDEEANYPVDYFFEKLKNNIYEFISDNINHHYALEFADYEYEYRHIDDPAYREKMKFLYYCRKIKNDYNLPVINIIDNIDLCSKSIQKKTWDSVIKLRDYLCDICRRFPGFDSSINHFVFIFTRRPETKIRDEIRDYEEILFPTPYILKIFIHCLSKCLLDIYKIYPNRDIHYTRADGKEFSTFADLILDLGNSIINSASDYEPARKKELIERFGDLDDFHNKIVDLSVRKFMNFIGFSIAMGGYRPLRDYGEKSDIATYPDSKESHDSVSVKYNNPKNKFTFFEYIRMLIRGPYEFHPGNHKIDGEGFDDRSPIVFNLFDFKEMGSDIHSVLDNYFIYIRILQILENNKSSGRVTLKKIVGDLSKLYSEKNLFIALKRLIFANIIIEDGIGVRNIQKNDDAEAIDLEDKDPKLIKFIVDDDLSPSDFYLNTLLCEYEYLFQMSVTTPLFIPSREPKDFDDDIYDLLKKISEIPENASGMPERAISILARKKELINKYCEMITYAFIKSMYIAIVRNIEKYRVKSEKINKFRELFNPTNFYSFLDPWPRLIDNFISVLKNKIEYGHRDNKDKVKDLEKTLKYAEQLKIVAKVEYEDLLKKNSHNRPTIRKRTKRKVKK